MKRISLLWHAMRTWLNKDVQLSLKPILYGVCFYPPPSLKKEIIQISKHILWKQSFNISDWYKCNKEDLSWKSG